MLGKSLVRLSLLIPLIFGTAPAQAGSPGKPEKLLPDSLKWDGKSFLTQTVEARIQAGKVVTPPRFEEVGFVEAGMEHRAHAGPDRIEEESPLGARIRSLVEDSLAYAFGRNGARPDFEYLGRIFQGTHAGILKGRVKLGPDGEEQVQYFWETPVNWVASLRKAADAGNRFKVSLAIIWVYQDKHSPNRFWAVVKQEWSTLGKDGQINYRDDGFLFLNFDLDGKRNPVNLSVNYRLWFYNYKRPDPKTRMKRHELIARDILGALDEQAGVTINFGRLENDQWVLDNRQRGISGIDRNLVNKMAADLVDGIRQAQGE